MKNVMEGYKLEIKTFLREAIVTSSNARVKDVLKKLEDKSITDRICSYSEVHYQTEFSQTW